MKKRQDLLVTIENQNDFKELTECGDIIVRENAKLDAPLLATSANIYLSENAKLDAPLLATSGYIELKENAKLVTKLTKKINYIAVDNTMFVIESEKNSKGIKIYSGYILRRFENKKLIKEACYVATKEKFFAHGPSVKKAVTDLQFKLISERIKKEPIKPNTIIDINYYRTVTGACEMGCKNFIKEHNLKKKYKAKELLPILEKHHAYGVNIIKELVTF